MQGVPVRCNWAAALHENWVASPVFSHQLQLRLPSPMIATSLPMPLFSLHGAFFTKETSLVCMVLPFVPSSTRRPCRRTDRRTDSFHVIFLPILGVPQTDADLYGEMLFPRLESPGPSNLTIGKTRGENRELLLKAIPTDCTERNYS
jgi:hypothetical protein